MSFACDGRGLPRLKNYAAALAFWERAEKWRDVADNIRVLDNRRKAYVTIETRATGEIECVLHSTPVLTYYPDNTIKIVPYPSVSTDEFFNRLIGYDMQAHFNRGYIRIGSLYYRANKQMRVMPTDDGYKLISETDPFVIKHLGADVAAKARKESRYTEFARWAKLLSDMDYVATVAAQRMNSDWLNSDWLRSVGDWPKLLQADGRNRIALDYTLGTVRAMVYKPYYQTLTYPCISDEATLRRWLRQ